MTLISRHVLHVQHSNARNSPHARKQKGILQNAQEARKDGETDVQRPKDKKLDKKTSACAAASHKDNDHPDKRTHPSVACSE